MRPSGQLPLPFGPAQHFAQADFRAAPSNAAAVAWLQRTEEWPGRRLALWGEAGCGKTHLLHIWAAQHGAEFWLGSSLRGLPELPDARGIALDDAESVADETALFHLLNAASEAEMAVLLASRTPPARWPVRLPDLASRLRAITAVEIGRPEDALLRAVLARLLDDRGLRPAEAVTDWLFHWLPRAFAAYAEAVARLDAASLDQRRDITVPLARGVLADLVATPPDEFSGTATPPSQEEPRLL